MDETVKDVTEIGDSRQRLIINCLPLTSEEQSRFVQAAAGVTQVFVNDISDRPNMLWHARVPSELRSKATAVIGNIDPDSIAQYPRLEWIQTWSAGLDAYVRPQVHTEHMIVTGASGAFGQTVSEALFALMWALMKDLPKYVHNQFKHQWKDEGLSLSPVGRKVVIVGTGDIGSHFALLSKAVGMETYGIRRSPGKPAAGVDHMAGFDHLDDFLAEADVVVLVVPAAPDTHHLLDARRMSLLKPQSLVLNAGRGDAIDPDALLHALQTNTIRGAGLDVTEPEPLPADNPLWDQPNCLITPHVAGGNHLNETQDRIRAIIMENVRKYVAGEPLPNRH